MILHIAEDEKFIDVAYNMFEKASPNNNKFIIISKLKKNLYIRTSPVSTISTFKLYSNKFLKSLKKYEFIVLHRLNPVKMLLVLRASPEIKFVWIGWGKDYYNFIKNELFMEKTKALQQKINSKKQISIKNILRKLYYRKINDVEKVFNKIDYFAPVLEPEYNLLSIKFKTFHPSYLAWNYGSLEDLLKGNRIPEINGHNILLGNSASFENNHLEMIDSLKQLDLNNRKIITPLSYGEMNYANAVIDYAQKKLGENFQPLLEFMPLDKYNKIISTCSIVIMNHLRQQGFGNIVTMMYLGAKVFLNKENPIYDFYKNKGAIIFTTDEINNKNISNKLTLDQINKNRAILTANLSSNVMLKKTKNLIKTMKNLNK